MIRLMIILGSTREGRFADRVANWVLEQVTPLRDFDIDFVDLRELNLPFFTDATPPGAIKDGNYQDSLAREWGERVRKADAFLILTPEYNHSYPAVLKNALDFVYHEWANKPVAFVGYGGVGGARAVEHLRGVVAQLQMVSVQEVVHMNIFPSPFDEDNKLIQEHYKQKLVVVLKQLAWWAQALIAARQKDIESLEKGVNPKVVSLN